MFDRPAVSETEPQGRAASADLVSDSVERLCRLYDSRLAETGGALSPEDARELNAMAAIYDLDTDRPAAEVWKDLRAVVTRQQPAVDPHAAPHADARPLTLLVVEDDADAAASLTELLSEAGHSVVGPFHNAAAAEAAAALHSIDAALLDINLSGEMTGVELARMLTARWDVRVVFVSGDVAAAARHADMAEALVLKPYNGAQILEAVARIGQTA